MSGTNVTEDVMKSIKCNANRKQFLFFDVVAMVFNLLVVQSLSLTFSFHMVTYYTYLLKLILLKLVLLMLYNYYYGLCMSVMLLMVFIL